MCSILKNSIFTDTDFVNLIFHVLRSIEMNRVTASMPYKEDGTIDLPKTLYTLVDTAFPRDGEPRESNFLVVV